MSLEKVSVIDQVEVLELEHIQVRRADKIPGEGALPISLNKYSATNRLLGIYLT